MSAPRVSVVVPTFQRRGYLAETLPTLLNQTLTDFEIIVADDGSTDGTVEYLKAVGDSRVRLLQPGHVGMPHILNLAIAQTCGRFVMTCHDHDLYEPMLLAELADALEKHPSAAFAFSGLETVDPEARRVTARYVHNWPSLMAGRTFLEEWLLPGLDSAVSALTMVRREAIGERLYDPRFGPVADVETWLRLAAEHDVAYVSKCLIRVRDRDRSSANFHQAPRLARLVLEAKSTYLQFAPTIQHSRIRRSWRAHVDQTVLAESLRALEYDHAEALTEIAGLAQEWGSWRGRMAMSLLMTVPTAGSLAVLRGLRAMVRLQRGQVVAGAVAKN